MNYQNKPNQKILDILEKRGVKYFDIEYFAWPQTFGTTTGPCGGIGGCAMSSFTVEVWVCDGYGPTIYVCNGMYHLDDSEFEPFKRIDTWMRIR